MTELVACLSTGKGTWGHVNRVIQDEKWESVLLITNDFGKENFTKPENGEFIVIDGNKPLKDMRDELQDIFKEKVKGTEVAVNLISGTGKEHMAIIGALLKIGVGIRLIALTKDGIEEI